MIKAGKIIFTICATATALTFNGCVFSSSDSTENVGQKTEIVAGNSVEPKAIEELIAESTVSKNDQPLKLRDLTKSATLSDGSQYVQMKDSEGNKVESRFFPDGSIVRSVIVKTSAGGAVKTFVRSWNGKVEQIEASSIATPWNSSARELALIAGFKKEPPTPNVQPVLKPTAPAEQNQLPNSTTAQPAGETTDAPLPLVTATEKK